MEDATIMGAMPVPRSDRREPGSRSAHAETQAEADAEARRTLAVGAYGTLVALAVFAAVVTSVAATARSLHAGVAGETWALSGMSLGLASTLLTAGALADDLGRRRVMVWSAFLLTITSALGALSPSMGVLVAARVLQGAAAAGVLTAALGAIGHAFPDGAARTHATAIWGAALGAGIAIGPVAGAALGDALGWRSSYWLEAAASAALVPAALLMPESRAGAHRALDLPGMATLAGSMAALTGGLVEGRSDWGSAATIALLAGGASLLVAFFAVEQRRRAPMVEPKLFTEPAFVASVTGALFTGLAVIGIMSFSSTLLQHAMHTDALGSGAVLATWSATSMVVAIGARRLPVRFASEARLALGLLLCAIGEAAFSRLGASSGWAALIPGLAIAGVGSGVANAALGRLAVESVPRERAGMGSGANNTARYLGGAAGVALVVVIATSAGSGGLIHGWDHAAVVCAALCALGAAIATVCGVLRSRAVG